MSLELHPLCTLFPRLEGDEFEALKADIEARGQLQPIVIHDGMILDGGNRYRACVELGVEPLIADMDLGDYDLLSYVLSVNLHRRHLTPGQHAAIVTAATNWLEARAQGGNGSNQHEAKEQRCNVAPLQTVADRAAKSGASIRTQKMADKVGKSDPELVKDVAQGKISLPKALKQVEGKDKPEAGNQPESSRVESIEESSRQSDPASMDDPEFETYLNGIHSQIETLQRANESLSATDQGAEMMKQVQLLLNAENSLATERERATVREKALRWFGSQYAELRKVLSVKNDRDVLPAVKKLIGEAK